MSSIIQEAMNTFAKLIPGGQNVASSGTTGTTPSPLSVADQFASFGKSLAGTPGEISGRLFGTGLTVVGSLLFAPLFGFSSPPTQPRPVTQSTPPSSSPPTRSVSQQPLPAFNMALPDVPGTLPSSYENTDLFRRYGVGEGEISEDRKHFSFDGEGFLLNEKRDSNFAGTYEFLIPLSSLGEPPSSAALPFNLHTLSINQMSHSAYGKERWDFDDGSSVLTVGSAVLHTAQILTG
jgi:hypothetical protein